MTRRFPPWRIRATTCLCPTFTTFTPFTWKGQGQGGEGESSEASLAWRPVPTGRTGKAQPHLDEEVSRAQPCPPGHALHIHRLEVLERREGRRGRELLDGSLCCGTGRGRSTLAPPGRSKGRRWQHSNLPWTAWVGGPQTGLPRARSTGPAIPDAPL